MKLNLALANIRHSLPRTIVSLAGIGIAIVLIFVQLGFRGAVENTALMIYQKLDFDLLLRSPDYLHFIDSSRIPIGRLNLARSIDGVREIVPFHVSLVNWRNPQSGELRGMILMGIDPALSTFNAPEVNADIGKLSAPNQILVDTESSAEFGPVNGEFYSTDDVGVETELAGQPVRIAGLFRMGAGLTANGAAIIPANGFARLVPWSAGQNPAMGLIKLADGVDPDEVRQGIIDLNRDSNGNPTIDVLTRRETMDREVNRWMTETPIGFVFSLGVATAFIVGSAIFYMVLSTDVANRLREYATLRAMGYSGMYLCSVVLRQAFYIALFAFVPSVILSLVFYEVTASLANLPIFMTSARLIFVFLLVQLMCLVSGILAMRKLWGAEPASLF